MNILEIGEEVVKFLVFGVGIGYLGRKLVADFLIREGKKFINSTERSKAIWQHYQKQATNQGHESSSVFECGEDKCKVFGMLPAGQRGTLLA